MSIKAAQVSDAPELLQNVPAQTTAFQISMEWTAPTYNGGDSVIDYQVWFDSATSGATWSEAGSGITDLFFTKTGLTQGLNY